MPTFAASRLLRQEKSRWPSAPTALPAPTDTISIHAKMLSGLNTGLPACGRIDRIAPPVSGPAALITASASPEGPPNAHSTAPTITRLAARITKPCSASVSSTPARPLVHT